MLFGESLGLPWRATVIEVLMCDIGILLDNLWLLLVYVSPSGITSFQIYVYITLLYVVCVITCKYKIMQFFESLTSILVVICSSPYKYSWIQHLCTHFLNTWNLNLQYACIPPETSGPCLINSHKTALLLSKKRSLSIHTLRKSIKHPIFYTFITMKSLSFK